MIIFCRLNKVKGLTGEEKMGCFNGKKLDKELKDKKFKKDIWKVIRRDSELWQIFHSNITQQN